jgi:hypothetical protein
MKFQGELLLGEIVFSCAVVAKELRAKEISQGWTRGARALAARGRMHGWRARMIL